jgi:hypothetical protein
MKIFFTALSLLALISCDAPQRTRLQSAYDSLGNPYTGTNPNPESSGGNTGNLTGSAGSGSDSSAGSEYSGCDYSYKYHTMDIGHFAVCQSSTDESKFKFKTQVANRNVQVCLIPTYRAGNGNSTYLGQPQCVFTEAGKDYEGKLYKTRSGFTGFAINGVIVMKFGLHTSYFNCMNAAVNYVTPSCPMGAATNANCAVAANQYMAQVCESFKNTYRNSYADISTR